jgi:hypothetical protein
MFDRTDHNQNSVLQVLPSIWNSSMDILKQLIINLGPGLVESLSSVTSDEIRTLENQGALLLVLAESRFLYVELSIIIYY